MSKKQLEILTEPMYYILLALLEERHGYNIITYVSDITGGRVRIGAGTLYNLLGRFYDEKIIEKTRETDRKKLYIITDKGRKLLYAEYERACHLEEDGARLLKA